MQISNIHRVLKYLISGSIATAVDLGLLYVLTDWLGVWYLASAVIAFLIAFVVSFTLQKFWTFDDDRTHVLVQQAGLYFAIVCGNLCINTVGMFLLVQKFHIWYLLSEVIMLGLIACMSFFLYQRFVFQK
jgi:putative flippase GtrA